MVHLQRKGEREREVEVRGVEKPQIPLSVMYVPQQGHTTPQTAPAAVDQVFKHVSLQGTFLKLPHTHHFLK